jgi:predicted PurR-regulated permease PerM
MEALRPLTNNAPSKRVIAVAAAVFSIGVCALGILILTPFIQPILWSIIFAVSTWPLYAKLRKALAPRDRLAAWCTTSIIGITALIIIGVLPAHLANELQTTSGLMQRFELDIIKQRLSVLPYLGPLLIRSVSSLAQTFGDIPALVRTHGAALFSVGALIVRGVVGSLAIFFAALIGCYLLFRHSEKILRQVGVAAEKLGLVQYRSILTTLHLSIMGSSLALFSTSVAQGVLLGLGCWLFGIATPVIFGTMGAILSLVPVGPTLVYIPLSLYLLFLTEHPWYFGLGLFAWGVGIVSTIDNFIRAYFISHTAHVSAALVFMGVVGGILAFGLLGLFIGPAVMVLGQRMWLEFTAEQRGAPEPQAASRAGHPLAF